MAFFTLGLTGAVVLSGCSSTEEATPTITGPITTINGKVLPVPAVRMENVTTMLDTIDADGKRLVITQGVRPAKSRAAIHIHEYGGHTCVISGTITDFVEGHEPMVFPAGTCYYMPPNTIMSATNLGTTPAILIDTFNLPKDAPTITIVEPDTYATPSN